MRASEIFSPEEILHAAKKVVKFKWHRNTADLGIDDAVQNLCLCVYGDKEVIDIPDSIVNDAGELKILDRTDKRKYLISCLKNRFKHVVERADFDKHLRRKKRTKKKGVKFLSLEAFETVDEQGNLYNPVEPETKYFKAKYYKVTERDLQEEVMLATLNYMETCEADTPAHTVTMRRDARVVRGFMNDVDVETIAKEEKFSSNNFVQILKQFYSQVRWNYYWRVPCGLEPVYDIWYDRRMFLWKCSERKAVSAAVTNFSKRVDTAVRCYNDGMVIQCIQTLNGIAKALQCLSLESSLYMSEEEAKTFDDASKKLYELVGKLLKTNQIEFSDDVFAPFKKV